MFVSARHAERTDYRSLAPLPMASPHDETPPQAHETRPPHPGVQAGVREPEVPDALQRRRPLPVQDGLRGAALRGALPPAALLRAGLRGLLVALLRADVHAAVPQVPALPQRLRAAEVHLEVQARLHVPAARLPHGLRDSEGLRRLDAPGAAGVAAWGGARAVLRYPAGGGNT